MVPAWGNPGHRRVQTGTGGGTHIQTDQLSICLNSFDTAQFILKETGMTDLLMESLVVMDWFSYLDLW